MYARTLFDPEKRPLLCEFFYADDIHHVIQVGPPPPEPISKRQSKVGFGESGTLNAELHKMFSTLMYPNIKLFCSISLFGIDELSSL